MNLPEGAQWFEGLSISCPTVLTIGVLDGVHRGHQHLLQQVVKNAKSIGGCSGVLTFEPHPALVVAPNADVSYLTTLADRIRLISEQGVDFVGVLHFTHEMAHMTPRAFVDMLLKRIKMVELKVGPDFAMGYRRAGTPEVLAGIGRRLGFTVVSVAPLKLDGTVVSSTEIRRLLLEGQVQQAAALLGRHPFLVGKVVKGFERGRTIGVPTANLEIGHKIIIPADGIYAVHVCVDDRRLLGALSIGLRPTFHDGGRRSIEVHILDFDEDLYGKTLRIEFVARLRDELHFDSVEGLVAQIRSDIAQTRALLGG